MENPKVLHRKYGSYSGPLIRGTDSIPSPLSVALTVEKMYWLACQVETGGKFGTVVMYDGTGVTGCPDQHVLVYPREAKKDDFNANGDQGNLTKLLVRLELVEDDDFQEDLDNLWDKLAAHNLYIGRDGWFRYLSDDTLVAPRKLPGMRSKAIAIRAGDLAHGFYLQNALTPSYGKVPKKGAEWERASDFAILFHRILAHPISFPIQTAFGVERICKSFRRRKLSGSAVINDYLPADITALPMEETISSAAELAWCIWYSHSVNAPSLALKILRSLRVPFSSDTFAEKLISKLAKQNYGRWHWSIRGGRYARTRSIAMKSGLWDSDLFRGDYAIMPAKF